MSQNIWAFYILKLNLIKYKNIFVFFGQIYIFKYYICEINKN